MQHHATSISAAWRAAVAATAASAAAIFSRSTRPVRRRPFSSASSSGPAAAASCSCTAKQCRRPRGEGEHGTLAASHLQQPDLALKIGLPLGPREPAHR
eukprot:SM000001S04419  [mRNA]  locus=s1:22397:22808:- [translate_table: standard]